MCSSVFLAVWGLALSSKNKTLQAYCHSCTLVISEKSFGTHLHLFPALKFELSGRHFRSNEEVRQYVKNYLRSLDIDVYQDGFFKLISRYDKCINAGGEYVGKQPTVCILLCHCTFRIVINLPCEKA
ncbi:hypothetical protein AVEN_82463-1 [Araneus ventricosus]|uniref:Uncharacterized protein n=1 Tax=Araneus ventricosus TaxID=182803 RepID=A0A4Y2JD96_ARAVE|nr:hypothetical protein AVEN_192698-1 [Araneus ventricosus]GBM88037.1 hypothetical protein AVEN_23838-1 [Araneus ventricosus]GBM88042.1 hypothetical protein AVEN_34770-1 [Araneus ventricosus]GBM88078.1 hypothetical protein AVEN_82463-1 [Araneus ventricosus]